MIYNFFSLDINKFKRIIDNNKRLFLIVCLVCIALLGLVLRSRIAFTTELWGDESISVFNATKVPLKDLILQTGKYGSIEHPSGYFLLLKLWIMLGFFDEKWIRLLSVALFLPTFVVIYKLSKSISLYSSTAIISVLVFSVHPLLVSLGYQARMYAITLFVCCLACLKIIHALENKKNSTVSAALLLAGAIYFDYLALWLLGGLLILVRILNISHSVIKLQLSKLIILALVFASPQLYILIQSLKNNGGIFPGSLNGVLFNFQFISDQACMIFGSCLANTMTTVFLLIICVLIVISYSNNNKIKTIKFLVVIIMSSSIIISFLFNPIFLSRNLALVSIFFCILFADFFKQSAKKEYFLVCLLLISFILKFFISSIQAKYDDGFIYDSGQKEISNKIASRGSYTIVLPTFQSKKILPYYFQKAGISPDSILSINDKLKSTDLEKMSKAKYISVLYGNDCTKIENCNRLLESVVPLCTKNNSTCELVKLP